MSPKTILITGAANGLGRSLAIEFHKRGYHLALLDVDRERLDQLCALLSSARKVTAHVLDIASESSVAQARTEILTSHQRIDYLINNAAISISQPFRELGLDDYRRLMDVNFWGTVYCCKHFLNDLEEQPDARIVNVISDFALMGFPGKTAYGSSKSAVLGLTHALKTELAGSTIKVCLVIPPPLDTELVRSGKHVNEDKRSKEVAFLAQKGMRLDVAARRMVTQIEKGKFRIVVGPMMYWLDVFSRLFPTSLHTWIANNKNKIDFV